MNKEWIESTIPSNPRFLNLLEERFERLTVEAFLGFKGKHPLWGCACICGETTVVTTTGLRSKSVRSCGCLRSEVTKRRETTHGMSEDPTYSCWQNMLNRCRNENVTGYDDYGGRGIKVCKRWEKFENFLEDMGVRPPEMTIERKNNNLGYSKGNCRWATKTDQANNRRSSRFVLVNGISMTVAQAARSLGVSYGSAYFKYIQK